MGFEQASPIQAEAIPVMMQGLDLVGQSQTGSGKTAAFAIPAIEKVDVQKRAVQVLILCPTRELAMQVCEEVNKLALFKRGIHALPVYGGQSYDRQISGLQQGAQIVIGTPGRIMDHMRRGTLRLDCVKIAILDEADVMLDMGFREDIEFILQAVPKERQTVFFSATMPRPIQDLIQRFSREPKNLRIEQKTLTVSTTEQVYYEVDRRFKIELMTRLVDIHDLRLGIIFCNTKRMVDDLADQLNLQGYSADRLHGDMTQAMRDRVMNKFRKGGLEFLVATDVAARGIDVEDVQVVVNYDLPYDPEDYVHRIGRTGRAGKSGLAISFVAGRELFQIRHIERFTNMRIQRGVVPSVDEVEEARASMFLEKVRATLKSGEYKRQDRLLERLLEEGFSSTDISSALIHHLQGGQGAEAAPAAPRASHEEERPRDARPSYGDRRPEGRDDRYGSRREGFDSPQERYEAPRPVRPVSPAAPRAAVHPLAKKTETTPAPAAPKTPAVAAVSKTHAVPAAPKTPAAPATPIVPAVSKTPTVPTAPTVVAVPAIPAVPKPARKKPAVPPVAASLAAATHGLTPVAPVVPAQAGSTPLPVVVDTGARPPLKPSNTNPKVSRKTPDEQTRLYMNIGWEMGIVALDVVQAIMGETGFPAKTVGTVDLRERHLFVDVASEHANAIQAKLNRALINGHKVKVKVA